MKFYLLASIILASTAIYPQENPISLSLALRMLLKHGYTHY